MTHCRNLFLNRLIATGLMLSGFWLMFGLALTRSPEQRLQQQAGLLIARHNYVAANPVVRELLTLVPNDELGQLFSATISIMTLQGSMVTSDLKRLTNSPNPMISERARFLLGERLFRQGQMVLAENSLRSALQLNPRNLKANQFLANLLYLEGRTWEARPFLEEQVRQGVFLADELVMLSSTEQWVTDDPHFRERFPEETRLELGLARIEILKNFHKVARARLERIVSVNPDLGEAVAALGRTIQALGDDEAFEKWQETLKPGNSDHPEVWQVLAMAAQSRGDRSESIRCCLSVLKRHPFHGVATYQLSQELSRSGELDLAASLLERARLISQVAIMAGDLRRIQDTSMMKQVCELQLKLGRKLEAAGWADMARRSGAGEEWADSFLQQILASDLTTNTSIPELNKIEELASLWTRHSSVSAAAEPLKRNRRQPEFMDVGNLRGLDFQYDIGKDLDAGMEHIFETTGAGVAVADLDRDGRKDLYFAQSGKWQESGKSDSASDKIFRNLPNGRFMEVADLAGIHEVGYSQGVTAGDLNEDGMPDLFVCNLGHDSCFVNNGDGTFTESAIELGVSSFEWSLSAAFADFNDDGLSDLYVVNYLNRDEVAAKVCKHEGQPRSCAPAMFQGAADNLYLNNGDGTFRDVSLESGIVQNDAKGLGLIVADFLNDGRLQIYVGNDTVANFFFVRSAVSEQGIPIFSEEATIRGIAYSGRGHAQATMGITASDISNDGLLDLFSTNFYEDANSLYVQTPEHYFEERTRDANLYDASFYMLGFGCQFIDSDRTGLLDLAVSNGHVDRTFATGEPDRMRPQYFQNDCNGCFSEAKKESLGGYFCQEMLGRAMAVLDWNNDGMQDLVVTHLDRPAALLENQSVATGNFVSLTMTGTKSPRLPVGTRLEILLRDGRKLYRQVTTGDGYQVRNDHRIYVGLGDSFIETMMVKWPSGLEEVYSDLPTNSFLTIMEGRGVFKLAEQAP